MRLATPVSNLFRIPEVAARIRAASDVLEGRDHTKDIMPGDQALFHFEASLVTVWDEEEKKGLVRILDERPQMEIISFHLASCCSHPVFDGLMFQPGGTSYLREELLSLAQANVRWLKGVLSGRAFKIAVENNNFYPTQAYRYVTDADFIAELVCENEIYFLLDLAHAQITAHNKGISAESYLAGLPMERAVQVHLSRGDINKSGLAWDAHELPDEAQIQQLWSILGGSPVEYVTVEYYKDADQLIKILSLLRECKRGGQ